jgi:hypothetical protein
MLAGFIPIFKTYHSQFSNYLFNLSNLNNDFNEEEFLNNQNNNLKNIDNLKNEIYFLSSLYNFKLLLIETQTILKKKFNDNDKTLEKLNINENNMNDLNKIINYL